MLLGLEWASGLDVFFPSIDPPQFTQLRTEPIRSAYGRELMFVTTLLDILADKTKATEFGFVFAFPHFGYLYGKLLPPPS